MLTEPEDHDTAEHLDFDAIEKKLREQSEQYRERLLAVKLEVRPRALIVSAE
jgi:hypothetical protein